MAERKFGRIVNITSGTVKIPYAVLGLSTAARLALTGFTATICREFVDRNVTMNGLLPGPFDTDRIRSTIGFASKQTGKSFDELYEQRRMQNPARRFGPTEEFGDRKSTRLKSSH